MKNGLLSGAGCLLMAGIGIFQVISGYIGIYYAFGWVGFIIASLIASVLRTGIPFMIGTFICCSELWGWPWPVALLVTMPGLLFLVPGVIAGLIGFVQGGGEDRQNNQLPAQKAEATTHRSKPISEDEASGSIHVSSNANPQFPGLPYSVKSTPNGMEITVHPNPGPLPNQEINSADCKSKTAVASFLEKQYKYDLPPPGHGTASFDSEPSGIGFFVKAILVVMVVAIIYALAHGESYRNRPAAPPVPVDQPQTAPKTTASGNSVLEATNERTLKSKYDSLVALESTSQAESSQLLVPHTPAPPSPQKPNPENVKTIVIGGKQVNIPIPYGYSQLKDFSDTWGNEVTGDLKIHLAYRMDYPGREIFTTISITTLSIFDPIKITDALFLSAKKSVRDTGQAFNETENSITVYGRYQQEHGSRTLQTFSGTSSIRVKDSILIATFTAATEKNIDGFPQWVRQSILTWRDAILAANKE